MLGLELLRNSKGGRDGKHQGTLTGKRPMVQFQLNSHKFGAYASGYVTLLVITGTTLAVPDHKVKSQLLIWKSWYVHSWVCAVIMPN